MFPGDIILTITPTEDADIEDPSLGSERESTDNDT